MEKLKTLKCLVKTVYIYSLLQKMRRKLKLRQLTEISS